MTTPALAVGSAVFSPERPVVIVPVQGATLAEVVDLATSAVRAGAEAVEWRIDALVTHHDLDRVTEVAAALREVCGDLPVLATFRTAAEGGAVAIDDADYLHVIKRLASDAIVSMVDVEMDRTVASDALAAVRRAGLVSIASFHDCEGTPAPKDLEIRLSRMRQMQADVCKVAVTPRHARDVVTLLDACVQHVESGATPLIGIAMGSLGVVTRVHGGAFGSCATFAPVGDGSAPGQIDLATTLEVRRLLTC